MMVWKLSVALLLIQLGVCLAMSHGNHESEESSESSDSTAELLLKMMADSDDKDSEEDKDHMDPEEALKMYLKKHGIEEGEDPLEAYLEDFLDKQEDRIKMFRKLQAMDHITEALIKDIFGKEEISDFAKQVIMNGIKEKVMEADEGKKILAMMFYFLTHFPESDQADMVKTLFGDVFKKMSPGDKKVIRAMVLHKLMMAKEEEEMDVLEDMFEDLMSEEMGGEHASPLDLMMMLIQAKAGNMHADPEKAAMTMLIMNNLAMRKDPKARKLLTHMATKLILGSVMPSKLPEDKEYLYGLPGPCLVMDGSTEVAKHNCSHGLECTKGPVNYRFNNRNLNYYMCDYPEEAVEYFVYHACEVTWDGEHVDKRDVCADSECELGPFNGQAGDTTYSAKFCTSYANYSADIEELHPAFLTACAIEDEVGFRSVQRKCPHDQVCTGKPMKAMYGPYPVKLYSCQEQFDKPEMDLALALKNAALGFEMDMEDDDEEVRFGGSEVSKMLEDVKEEDLLNKIIMTLWGIIQKGGIPDHRGDMSHGNELEALRFFLEWADQMFPALPKVLELFEEKDHLGIATDEDWAFLDAIIVEMLELHHMQQNGRGGDSKESDEDKSDYDKDDHEKEHENIREHLKKLRDMIGDSTESKESESEEDSDSKEKKDDLDQKLVDLLFQQLLMNNNKD